MYLQNMKNSSPYQQKLLRAPCNENFKKLFNQLSIDSESNFNKFPNKYTQSYEYTPLKAPENLNSKRKLIRRSNRKKRRDMLPTSSTKKRKYRNRSRYSKETSFAGDMSKDSLPNINGSKKFRKIDHELSVSRDHERLRRPDVDQSFTPKKSSKSIEDMNSIFEKSSTVEKEYFNKK